MYFQDYMWYLGVIFLCMLLSAAASTRVKSRFSKYNGTPCSSGLSGYETAKRLMSANGVTDISVGSVGGFLSDHYNPKKKIVNLSESTYQNNSVSAVAVAAHEIGHVMQRKDGYIFYKVRTAIVPAVNFGSRMAMPLVLLGVLINFFSINTNAGVGFYIAMAGVLLYGGSILFALVTLPVELNASARAQKMLLCEGILKKSEIPMAKEVLSAAALTYLASLITSIAFFLRFLFLVMTLFGRRSRR